MLAKLCKCTVWSDSAFGYPVLDCSGGRCGALDRPGHTRLPEVAEVKGGGGGHVARPVTVRPEEDFDRREAPCMPCMTP